MNFVMSTRMMKICSMAAFVLCLLSAPAFADKPPPVAEPKPAPVLDYQAGAAAYDAGDYAKALSIWKPLAEKGDTQAQRGMGKLYEKGRGVDRDFATAIKWYRPAAEKGDAESQYRLSVAYGWGLGGVEKRNQTMEQGGLDMKSSRFLSRLAVAAGAPRRSRRGPHRPRSR